MYFNTIITDIESIACSILQSYPVKRAALFGSAARNDISDKSDIDILVEFLPGRGGVNFEFFGLQADLEEAFGRKIDLITFNSLKNEAKSQFKKNVQNDLRIIYERENWKHFVTYVRIAKMVLERKLIPCHDYRIFLEYKQVLLRPKFNFNPADVGDLLDFFQKSGISVTAEPTDAYFDFDYLHFYKW